MYAIVIKAVELCAAGANLGFRIDNDTGKNDQLFWITKLSLCLSEVFCKCSSLGGGGRGGGKQATLSLGGGPKCPHPPGSASDLNRASLNIVQLRAREQVLICRDNATILYPCMPDDAFVFFSEIQRGGAIDG